MHGCLGRNSLTQACAIAAAAVSTAFSAVPIACRVMTEAEVAAWEEIQPELTDHCDVGRSI
jgi:Xaa-Pro aminopeptidase